MRPALLLLLALARCAGPAPADDGPWRAGAVVVDGWRVTAIERRPEFVRVRLADGGRATGVEIGARQPAPSEWATLQHRVQPAPGEAPPNAVLLATRDGLRAWEAGASGRGLVRRVDDLPARSIPAAAPGYGALVAAWALVLMLVLALLGRRDPRARGPLALVGAGALVVALCGTLVPAASLPVGWLTALHEGLGRWGVEQLHARAVHAGPLAAWLAQAASAGSAPGLRDVAWLNTLLAGVNLAAGAAAAWLGACSALGRMPMEPLGAGVGASSQPTENTTDRLPGCLPGGGPPDPQSEPDGAMRYGLLATGSALAAPLAAATLLLCPPFVLAAGSELAAQPVATLAFGAAAALALLARAPGRGERALACASLALATALAGLLRAELLLPAGAALLIALARTALGDARLSALGAGLRARLAPRPARASLLLAVLASGAALTALNGPHLGKLEWVVAGLNPLDPSLLHVPAALALTLPTGAALLVLLAVARALLVPGAPRLVPLAVLVLVKTAVAAALDNPYVLTRLLAYLLPLALLAALPSLPALAAAAHRVAARSPWPRPTLALLFALGLAPGSLTGLPALSPWAPTLARDGAPQVSLDRNTQAEVRALVAWSEAHPDCVLVTRVVAADRAVEPSLPWQWKVFGGPLAQSIDRPFRPGDAPARLAADAAPRATCRLLYCGLDTNLVQADGCPEAAGLPVVEEWRFASRPYVRAQTFGTHRAEIRLGLYRLP